MQIEKPDPKMIEILRNKTAREKLEISWGMWRMAREMIRNLLRDEHPDWPQSEIDREVARRLAHGTD